VFPDECIDPLCTQKNAKYGVVARAEKLRKNSFGKYNAEIKLTMLYLKFGVFFGFNFKSFMTKNDKIAIVGYRTILLIISQTVITKLSGYLLFETRNLLMSVSHVKYSKLTIGTRIRNRY